MGFTDNPLGQETNWSLDVLSQCPSRICMAVSSQCYQCPAAFYSLPPSAFCFGFTWRWRLALSLENILIAWKAEKQNCQNLGYNYSLIETSLYVSKNCSHLAMFSFKEMETEKKETKKACQVWPLGSHWWPLGPQCQLNDKDGKQTSGSEGDNDVDFQNGLSIKGKEVSASCLTNFSWAILWFSFLI